MKAAFWRSWFTRTTEIIPIFNERGIMLCIQRPTGTFESREVAAPEAMLGTTQPWYVGQPINLIIRAGAVYIGMATLDEQNYARLYEGSPQECGALLTAVRQAWLEVNLPKIAGDVASVSGVPRMPRRRKWGVAATVALVVGLVATGAGGMHLYLRQSGPGLDLSSMSVQDVAALDANPVAVRNLQNQLMVAMQTGQAEAKKMTGKIEQDHLSALTAMGLQPGVSVKNAMACLATK